MSSFFLKFFHSFDCQIGLQLRVRSRSQLDSTQSYYHYKSNAGCSYINHDKIARG